MGKATPAADPPVVIGSAALSADGTTVHLRLRATGDGIVGDAELELTFADFEQRKIPTDKPLATPGQQVSVLASPSA